VTKEANRSLPEFTDDDVLDYMITEAIIMKANEDRKEAQAEAEREQWRKAHKKNAPKVI
jgi:hypothetical protein